jgi:hypothetical protein
MEIHSEAVNGEEAMNRKPIFIIRDLQDPRIVFSSNDIHGI